MTLQQLIVMMCIYLAVLAIVICFTRPTLTRIVGALAGGAVAGCLLLIVFVLGNMFGLWRAALPSSAGLLTLLYIVAAISCAPIYLGTWWIVRRFGRHGFTVFIILVAITAPPRDYLIAAKYPEWMVFRSGIVPILADAAAYIAIVVLGHVIMRLVAGPSRKDGSAQLL